MPPIVEVARDDDRQVARGEFFQTSGNRLELAAAAALVEREVHAYAMQVPPPPGHCDHAVQQAAAFIAMVRDVLVLERKKTEARENRVAMVAVVVHRVAAIDVLPAISCEISMLRLAGRGGETH